MRGLPSFVLASVWMLTAAVAAAADDTDRLIEIYMEELTRETKVPAALAAKLVIEAAKVTDKPRLRAALYDKAYAYGIRSPDGYASALAAVEAVLRDDADDVQARAKLIKVCQLLYGRRTGRERSEMGKKLLSALADAGQACLEQGKGEDAADYYKRAAALARTLRSPRAAEMGRKVRQAYAAKRAEGKIEKLMARLKRNPKDAEARMGLITYYLVERDAPGEAAKFLAESVPPLWRKNVPLATKDPDNVDEADCLALGKWYAGLSKSAASGGKAPPARKAAVYLERYLARHARDDASAKAAKALLREVKRHVWIDLLALADPSTSSTYPRLQIPLTPEGSFDLQVRFVWASGSGSISIYFPARGPCHLNLSDGYGYLSGLITSVDSRGRRTYRSGSWTIRLTPGRTHTLEVRVLLGKKKSVAVSARLDGGKEFSWQGQPRSSSSSFADSGMQLYGRGRGIRFVSAKLRMLSGKVRYPPKQPPATSRQGA